MDITLMMCKNCGYVCGVPTEEAQNVNVCGNCRVHYPMNKLELYISEITPVRPSDAKIKFRIVEE
jgi:hypothetical protein